MDWDNDRPNEGLSDGCFVVEEMIWRWRLEIQMSQSLMKEGMISWSRNFREHSRVDGHEWKSGDIRVSYIPPAALRAERFIQGRYDWVLGPDWMVNKKRGVAVYLMKRKGEAQVESLPSDGSKTLYLLTLRTGGNAWTSALCTQSCRTTGNAGRCMRKAKDNALLSVPATLVEVCREHHLFHRVGYIYRCTSTPSMGIGRQAESLTRTLHDWGSDWT